MKTLLVPLTATPEEVAQIRAQLRTVRRKLHPWMDRLLGQGPEAAREALECRWARLRHPSFVALRVGLLNAEPVGLVVADGPGLIKLRKLHGAEAEYWHVPPPLEKPHVERALKAVGLA